MTKPIHKMTVEEFQKHQREKTQNKSRALDTLFVKVFHGAKTHIVKKVTVSPSECSDHYKVTGKCNDFIILSSNEFGDGRYSGTIIFDDGIVVSDVGIQLYDDRVVIS
jgi:hypothetical protein